MCNSCACIKLCHASNAHLLSDSEEANKLELLKKTSAEDAEKTNKRRMKFQAQDSVLVEPMGNSVEEG